MSSLPFSPKQVATYKLVESGGARRPSEAEVRAAICEACGDSGALQLLGDLLNDKDQLLEFQYVRDRIDIAAAGLAMMAWMHDQLIEFEQTDAIIFCKICGTHLALERHVTETMYALSDLGVPERFLKIPHMVNIVLSNSCIVEDEMTAQVSCKRCLRSIGYRTVYVLIPDGHKVTGQFVIDTKNLRVRNGDHVVRDAHTGALIVGDWKPLVSRFNLQEHGNFYQCRSCATHLVRAHDVIKKVLLQLPEYRISRTAVNMHSSTYVPGHDQKIANVHCSVCYRWLGFINVDPGSPLDQTIILDRDSIDFVTELVAGKQLIL